MLEVILWFSGHLRHHSDHASGPCCVHVTKVSDKGGIPLQNSNKSSDSPMFWSNILALFRYNQRKWKLIDIYLFIFLIDLGESQKEAREALGTSMHFIICLCMVRLQLLEYSSKITLYGIYLLSQHKKFYAIKYSKQLKFW